MTDIPAITDSEELERLVMRVLNKGTVTGAEIAGNCITLTLGDGSTLELQGNVDSYDREGFSVDYRVDGCLVEWGYAD